MDLGFSLWCKFVKVCRQSFVDTICLTLTALSQEIQIFSHLNLCLATAIHNFKWLKISLICKIEVEMIITDLGFSLWYKFVKVRRKSFIDPIRPRTTQKRPQDQGCCLWLY